MGMYDELEFGGRCKKCGAEVDDIQTKRFDSSLTFYRFGDRIDEPGTAHIYKEDVYCEECRDFTGKVWIVVLDGIYMGAFYEAKAVRFELLDWMRSLEDA